MRNPSAYKPGSVEAKTALRTVISLGTRSPASSGSLPAAFSSKRTASRRLFGLAPAGVCRAVRVATNAVGSYPTVSPLPTLARGRSFLCGTVRHSRPSECPGVTWQPVHGARTFLEATVVPLRRDRPAEGIPPPKNSRRCYEMQEHQTKRILVHAGTNSFGSDTSQAQLLGAVTPQ